MDMTIAYTDLVPIPEDVARQVLTVARSIAPCITSLADDSEEKKDAVAILKSVATAGIARGGIKSQRIGPAAIEYVVDGSWFTADNRAGLRVLCGADGGSSFHPIGQFPLPSRATRRIFPPEIYE